MNTRRVAAIAPASTVGAALIVYPLLVPRFWILSIGSQSIILGIVALSLVFMSGYGGMVSMAQAAVAGLAGYAVAIATLRLGLAPIPAGIVALMVATLIGGTFGAIAARSHGNYFLMLTLALAVGVFYFATQNYDILKGHIGFAGILGPTGSPRANPVSFYYLCLAVGAGAYFGLRYLVRSPLGLTFQGIRDNPRRMRALGYWVPGHRIVIFAIGGFVAGLSGVLGIWYSGVISPGFIDLTRTIDVLIIAVVGGLSYPIGAFVGALFFVLVQAFASSIEVFGVKFDERFNTLIGLSFLLVVLFSPSGLVGLAARARDTAGRRLFARHDTSAAPTGPGDAAAALNHPAEAVSTASMDVRRTKQEEK